MKYILPKYKTVLVRDGEVAYPVSTVDDARRAEIVARAVLELEAVECMLVIHLASSNAIIGLEVVSRGGVAGCAVTPAEIFRGAILSGARAIVLAHNHPSGDPTPSNNDLLVTREAVRAGELLGVEVLDHIIVARDLGIRTDVTVCLRDHVPALFERGEST